MPSSPVQIAGDDDTRGDTGSGLRTGRAFTNKKINVLLDETNFLVWKQQILLTVRSHRLEKLLKGTLASPPAKVQSADGTLVDNDEYEAFVAQDSALASWLLSTMNPNLLSHFVGAETAAEIWTMVVDYFSSRSTTTVMSLHFRLRSLRKGDMSMRLYISKVKEICDALASCGSPVSTTEHIASILNGLPVEYRPFVAVITASRDPFTLDGVTAVLIDAEAQQAMFDQDLSVPMSAHNVQFSTGSGVNNVADSQDKVNRSSSGSGNRGRFRNRYQCQLCGKMGHLVDRCYRRFDQSFAGITAGSSKTRNNETSSNDSSNVSPVCNVAGVVTHHGGCIQCPQNVASSSHESWLIDTGATHHVSPDTTTTHQCSDYNGPVC